MTQFLTKYISIGLDTKAITYAVTILGG